MTTFNFEEIDGGNHRCGYKLKQHVLQTADVDAKIVEKGHGSYYSDLLLVADADRGESYEERMTLYNSHGHTHDERIVEAKKILVENVLRIAPTAKPGKRSV